MKLIIKKRVLVFLSLWIALTLSFTGRIGAETASSNNPDKALLKAAQSVHGGKNYETTFPIEFNRDYKLDHHQKTGEFDYFVINVEPDLVVTLELRTFEKGMSWNKGRRTVTTEPFAGLQLQDDKKNPLADVQINSMPNTVQKSSFRNRSVKGGSYYLLVGNLLGGMNKDQVIFKLSSTPFVHGDLGTDQDAGADIAEALPMMIGHYYPINSIGGGDSKDTYSFSAHKDDWYAIAVRAVDSLPTAFLVTVTGYEKNDRTKPKKIISYTSGGSQQVISKSFQVPKDGEYFIEINLMDQVPEKSLYSLELSRVPNPKKP